MILYNFKKIYKQLDVDNIVLIEEIYSADISFQDPFHRVNGLIRLKSYFQDLYQDVETIDFDFGESVSDETSHFVTWTMSLKHPKLNGNKLFKVDGSSWLKTNSDGLICFHRDYFDAGEMLYEKIPLLGRIILWLKGRM
jgi:hypothetical protein